MRALAVLAVITIHVTKNFIGRAEKAGDFDSVYWTASAFDSASRWAVPVFFAIAGWVLLVGAPVRSREDLARRARKALVPMLVWGYLYIAFGWLREGRPKGASQLAVEAVEPFVQAPTWGGHMWYLFVYIPLLLVLGTAVLHLRRQPTSIPLLAWLGAVVALPSILVVASHLYEPFETLRSDWALAAYPFLYALLGALVLRRQSMTLRARTLAVALYVAFVLVTMLAIRTEGRGATTSYATYFTMLASTGVLLALVGVRVPARASGLVAAIGRASFGAYLIHQMLIWALWGNAGALSDAESRWWVIALDIVWSVGLVYVLSVGAAMLWGRSPRLRSLLG